MAQLRQFEAKLPGKPARLARLGGRCEAFVSRGQAE